MADSRPLGSLLDCASKVFSLAGELASTFCDEIERQGGRIEPGGWHRHAPVFEKFCNALLELRDAIQHPPDGFAPVAQPLWQAARLAREIRDTVTRTGGFTAYRDYIPELNTVSFAVREAVEHATAAQRTDDPFAFVDEVAFSLLDRFPATQAGHLAFLEWVRDEVRYAANAKRNQLEREYSNETIAKMVRGIKWAEAKARLAALRDVPELVRSNTFEVLSRELTAGTVEQIEPMLTQLVDGVRDSLERAKFDDLSSKVAIVSTAGEMWKAYADGKEPQIAISAFSLRPAPVVPHITCPDQNDEARRNALDRANALVTAEGGDKAEAMERLIARVQLQADLDKASVLRMPLTEFVAVATGRAVDRRPGAVRAGETLQRLMENDPNVPAFQEQTRARLQDFAERVHGIVNGPEYRTPHNWEPEDWQEFDNTIRDTLNTENDSQQKGKAKSVAPSTDEGANSTLAGQAEHKVPTAPKSRWLGDVALAEALGVEASQIRAFRQKLKRMRDKGELSVDDWHVIESRKRNESQFVYRPDAPGIVAMAKRYSHPK